MTTKLLKNIGVVKVNNESSEYNDIYDVLQNLQNKKGKPKFDEENYKCKQHIIDDDTISDLTLNLTCDEGRILKYILLILLKFNNKKLINNNLIDGEILLLKINKIIISLREKHALYSSKDSLTINQQITSIISSFVLSLKPIITQPVKPNSLKRDLKYAKQDVKTVSNATFEFIDSMRKLYKGTKNTINKIDNTIKGEKSPLKHIDLSDKPKNIYVYIINILESIRDKIEIIVRLNAQIKLDPENNKYIPINDVCINGKKVLAEKTDEKGIKTKILTPEKCNTSDYEFNDFVFY